jgi:hypothetical protein
MNTLLKTFYVAGVSFRPASVIDPLGTNEKIRLVAEPTNEYDKQAIKIEALFVREVDEDDDTQQAGGAHITESWEHIGYIPKGDTWLFHLLRGLGVTIKLRMDVNKEAAAHRMLLVTSAVETNPELEFRNEN